MCRSAWCVVCGFATGDFGFCQAQKGTCCAGDNTACTLLKAVA
jgi:hypothetical protein